MAVIFFHTLYAQNTELLRLRCTNIFSFFVLILNRKIHSVPDKNLTYIHTHVYYIYGANNQI